MNARLIPAMIGALLALAALVGCASAPVQPLPSPTRPAARAPTVAPIAAPPTQAPRTQPPTAAPPTAAPPTHAPTARAPTETPAPTAAPQPAVYIVYSKPDGSLWRADGHDEQPVQLAGPAEPGAVPPWAASPDGRTIAFVTGVGVWNRVSDAKPALALWLVEADGTNPRKVQDLLPPQGVEIVPGGETAFDLLPALTDLQELAWSPDGGLVAFVSDHENQVDLYAATRDGKLTRLTNTPELEQGPRWSPDGGMIAYRTTTSFGTGAGWGDVALAVTARDGGKPIFVMDDRKLATGNEAGAIPDLIWIGPDTLVIGLWSLFGGNTEIRELSVSAGTSAAIFAQPYSALAWNGAARQLAIAGASESVIESGKERELTPGLYTWTPGAPGATQIAGGPVEALAWNAPGDALAYSVAKSGKQPGVSVWSLGTEGDVKHLADAPAQQLRWSPDGQRLVAETTTASPSSFTASATIYSRDGRKLAALDGEVVLPIGWAPQGLFYYTLAAGGQSHDLWLWDGEQSRQIASGLDRTERTAVVFERS